MSVEFFIRRMGYVDGRPANKSFEVVVGAADPSAPEGCHSRLTKTVERDEDGNEVRTHFDGGTSETFYFPGERDATAEAIKAAMDLKETRKVTKKIDGQDREVDEPTGRPTAREKMAAWCADHCKPSVAKDMTPKKEADLRLV